MYNPLQSMNAFAMGQNIGSGIRNKKTQNAFSQMVGDKDYSGARDYAYGRGAMELGGYADSMIAGQEAQALQSQASQADAQKTKIGQLKSLTENMLSIPEAQRGEFLMGNWQQIEPIVGTDFMSFWQASGGDVSDRSLNEDLAMFRAQLGEAPPEAPEAPSAASPLGKITQDVNNGFITQDQADAAISRANAPRQPVAQVTVNPTPDQYAESLLAPPQTKGKDPAIVFDADGFARVSPNAQQQGLNKAALKFNDLAAKNALVQDDISRALDHFTAVDESGIRSVKEGQNAVGWKAAFADIPIFGGSTEAGTMQSFLTTLQANVGFGELQAMREASPTGGALGQVSEREIAFLQALLGDIEQSRDPKVLMYNLERLQTFMDGRQERFRKAFEADYPSLGESIQREQVARSDVTSLLNYYAPEQP